MIEMTAAMKPRSVVTLLVITGFSGFAGLGYEIVWTRLLANAFGHEIVAVLGVLAALFAGLALGSLLLGPRVAESPRPGFWYAGLELAIAVWALVFAAMLPVLNGVVPVLTPADVSPLRQWAVAFAIPLVALLPATAAMGATLPALEAMLARRLPSGRAVGWSYAANTFGAVVGTLTTAFWLLAAVGASRTLLALAAVNLGCALAMAASAPAMKSTAPCRPQHASHSLVPLFATGLLGIGYEVVAVRTLSQILENTVYTFAGLLAVYLIGTAIGAALHGWLRRLGTGATATGRLAVAACLATVLGAVVLGNADLIVAKSHNMPQSPVGMIAVELVLAASVFLLPTIAMGTLFTALAQDCRDRDGNLARAFAANTAGAACAPVLFGPLLFPILGAKVLIVMIAAGYALVAPEPRLWALVPCAAGTAVAVAFFIFGPSLRFVRVPAAGALIWHHDGMMASVSVVEDRAHDRHLQINNHFRMGTTASIRSDYREADIPLLLHENPKRALFLGLGTGATISAAGDHPGLAVEGVELVPEVVETFALFARSAPNLGRNGNMRIHTGDARRYVQATGASRYDVVVADVYHPWIDGAGTLYTREHFAAIRALLSERGLFCQWLPLHQLDLPAVQLIVRTFLAAFPQTKAYLAQFSIGTPLIALVGTNDERRYPADWFAVRTVDEGLRARLASVDLADEMALFGLFLGDAADLAHFGGDGPLNTDDRPALTFAAPRLIAVAAEPAGARLLALLAGMHPRTQSLLTGEDGVDSKRLADYWLARDRFLELGVNTVATANSPETMTRLVPQLIEIVRLSADFDAAYRPVLAMADVLSRTDPEGARRILMLLDKANPTRAEARGRLTAMPAE